MSDERVDLAHTPDFTLGRLAVRPATRELVRDDGERDVLEPRVMQVLVALARANGGIVTRDELSRWCWEDRVVGEDAINRVISRLRRSGEGIGEGAFRVETITKVGYRLTGAGIAAAQGAPAAIPAPVRFDRRFMLAGTGAAAVIGAAGWVALRQAPSADKPADSPPSPQIAALMQQARLALRQDNFDGQSQAIGLYRRVVALQPGYADGWGSLAIAYGVAARFRPTAESDQLHLRAEAAARRALAIDPGNAFGQTGLATAQPQRGHWLAAERAMRTAVDQHGDNDQLLFALAALLVNVDRNTDALPFLDRITALRGPTPGAYYLNIQALCAAGRAEEADRLVDEASSLYPLHLSIWFTRFNLLMYGGHTAQAIAMAEDRTNRPSGLADAEYDAVLLIARAIQNPTPAMVDKAMRFHIERAHRGAGYAENTIAYAAVLGHVDDAFTIADAYFFGRGFEIPEVRFTEQQGTYSPLRERQPTFLFQPSTARMRTDPRFATLIGEIGLERYWRESATQPDYRKTPPA